MVEPTIGYRHVRMARGWRLKDIEDPGHIPIMLQKKHALASSRKKCKESERWRRQGSTSRGNSWKMHVEKN